MEYRVESPTSLEEDTEGIEAAQGDADDMPAAEKMPGAAEDMPGAGDAADAPGIPVAADSTAQMTTLAGGTPPDHERMDPAAGVEEAGTDPEAGGDRTGIGPEAGTPAVPADPWTSQPRLTPSAPSPVTPAAPAAPAAWRSPLAPPAGSDPPAAWRSPPGGNPPAGPAGPAHAYGFSAQPERDPVMTDPGFAPIAKPDEPARRITAPFSALTRSRGKPEYEQNGQYPPAESRQPAPRPPVPAEVRHPAAPTRRAQLVLARIEPWSVMKFSFMISLVAWIVLFVAVTILYFTLDKIGVFHSIESTVGQVTSGKGNAGTNASSWFAASRVLGYTMIAGAVNIVLITALATVGAVIYNLVSHLTGGVEVTLKETD